MMSIKNLLLSFFTLVCLTGTLQASEAEFSIYLTRHMEKQSGVKDPSLTEKGQKSAQYLAKRLLNKDIKAIYSTDYNRTRETAAPLAKELGIEVSIYDPSDLPKVAAEIKNKKQNALIVGHSNTTPVMTYLLSGKPQRDIDESDYSRRFEVAFSDKTEVIYHHVDDEKQPVSGIHTDTSKLHNIQATYNMLLNGEQVGFASYDISITDNNIVMVEKTQIAKFNIDATINVIADKRTLTPISMSMSGSMGAPADINLQWSKDGSRVSGHSLMPRAPYKQQGKLNIDGSISDGTVERTGALLAIPFFDFDKTHNFRWYDAYENQTRVIEVTQLGMETVTVPAGTFHTNKVKLQGGAPSQLFYLSNEPQPKVIKIEVLGMPWVYELASIK